MLKQPCMRVSTGCRVNHSGAPPLTYFLWGLSHETLLFLSFIFSLIREENSKSYAIFLTAFSGRTDNIQEENYLKISLKQVES